MDNGFAVDETGMTADGYRTLPKNSVKSMYVKNFIKFAILSVIVGLVIHFWEYLTDYDRNLGSIIVIAFYVIIVLYLIIGPRSSTGATGTEWTTIRWRSGAG
jgi:hypothetical protein